MYEKSLVLFEGNYKTLKCGNEMTVLIYTEAKKESFATVDKIATNLRGELDKRITKQKDKLHAVETRHSDVLTNYWTKFEK